jgi:hypothetical protein
MYCIRTRARVIHQHANPNDAPRYPLSSPDPRAKRACAWADDARGGAPVITRPAEGKIGLQPRSNLLVILIHLSRLKNTLDDGRLFPGSCEGSASTTDALTRFANRTVEDNEASIGQIGQQGDYTRDTLRGIDENTRAALAEGRNTVSEEARRTRDAIREEAMGTQAKIAQGSRERAVIINELQQHLEKVVADLHRLPGHLEHNYNSATTDQLLSKSRRWDYKLVRKKFTVSTLLLALPSAPFSLALHVVATGVALAAT